MRAESGRPWTRWASTLHSVHSLSVFFVSLRFVFARLYQYRYLRACRCTLTSTEMVRYLTATGQRVFSMDEQRLEVRQAGYQTGQQSGEAGEDWRGRLYGLDQATAALKRSSGSTTRSNARWEHRSQSEDIADL